MEKLIYYDVGVVGEIKNYKINEFKTDFVYKFIKYEKCSSFFVMKFGDEKGNICLD